MQELDVMLGGWLDSCWSEADIEQRRAFDRMLDIEDDRLWDWLLGRAVPEPEFEAVVERIRACHFPGSRR